MTSPTLVAEATRRSAAVWVAAAGAAPSLVWHVWHDGAVYLVGGGPEQPLPVSPGDRALVAVRSRASQSGVVVEWAADVERVEPGTPLWDEVVPVLAGERLNAEAGREARWAQECVVLRLAPAGA